MPATVPPALDPLPTPPSTSDPANFDARGDAFLGALPEWGDQLDALAENAYDNAVEAATQAGLATTNGATQVGLATTQAGIATTQAAIATTQAGLAAISAASAVNSPGTSGTSTTSLSVSAASKSLTTQTGKNFVVGQPVMIARTSDPGVTWMSGNITAYDSGTGAMTVNCVITSGSGTFTDWTISLTAPAVQAGLTVVNVSGTSQVAVAGSDYMLNNVAATAVTAPTTLTVGNKFRVCPNNGLYTNSIDFGAKTVRGPGASATGVVLLDSNAPMELTAIDANTWMMS